MVIPDIQLETSLWEKGLLYVAGVDEAGKGPLAGPVTAGAVMICSPKQVVPSVRDSKLMSAKQREKAFSQICERSTSFGVGIVSEKEIDTLGIDEAVKMAMQQALLALEKRIKIKLDFVLVDGSKTKTLENYFSQKIKKGGLYHYSISAGSILAKVTRDRIMHQLSFKYPEYLFERHVGYGTKVHLEALKNYGPCDIHRMSFAPVRNCLQK